MMCVALLKATELTVNKGGLESLNQESHIDVGHVIGPSAQVVAPLAAALH